MNSTQIQRPDSNVIILRQVALEYVCVYVCVRVCLCVYVRARLCVLYNIQYINRAGTKRANHSDVDKTKSDFFVSLQMAEAVMRKDWSYVSCGFCA